MGNRRGLFSGDRYTEVAVGANCFLSNKIKNLNAVQKVVGNAYILKMLKVPD